MKKNRKSVRSNLDNLSDLNAKGQEEGKGWLVLVWFGVVAEKKRINFS